MLEPLWRRKERVAAVRRLNFLVHADVEGNGSGEATSFQQKV